jgi:hypothetical protein
MTNRERPIVRAILEFLHLMDGAQVTDQLLHAEVNLRVSPTATLTEFNGAMGVCDGSGWIMGIVGRYGRGRLWCITDAGEVAWAEMR